MDGLIFDNVKYEKAKAIARFNRFLRIKKLLKVIELVVVLMILSWSSKKIPPAARFSGELLFGLSGYLLNPHVVFLIGNAIIIALFLLCKQNDAGNLAGDGDLYDDRRPVSPSAVEPPPQFSPEETSEAEDGGEPEEKEMQIAAAENDHRLAVETAIVKAGEQIQRFERTQSEKLRREIAARPEKELRRSETENSGLVVSSGGGEKRTMTSSIGTVDNLSNEEFKLAIDAFIDKHRVFFKEQKMAELKYI